MRKISREKSSTSHIKRLARISRVTTKNGRNNACRVSIENHSYKANLQWSEYLWCAITTHFNKTSLPISFMTGTVPETSHGKKRKKKKKRMKKKQSRWFHVKWRFRSTGITLNLRIGRVEERERRRRKEIDSREWRDRKGEKKRRTRVNTVDKCTCIPSYCISSNYLPRSHNDREVWAGEGETEKEKQSGMLRRNYFTQSCDIYITSEDCQEEVGIETQRKSRARIAQYGRFPPLTNAINIRSKPVG